MSSDSSAVSLLAGQVPILKSSRLLLRPLHDDDASNVQILLNDFEIIRWMSRIPFPYAVADAHYYIKQVAPSEISWAIDVVGNGLAGISSFTFKPGSSDIELGYWLGRRYWGQGYATEAARLMIDYAWSAGAKRIMSGTFDGNMRSQRVLKKCGFRVTGESTRFNLARDTDFPHVDMMIERST